MYLTVEIEVQTDDVHPNQALIIGQKDRTYTIYYCEFYDKPADWSTKTDNLEFYIDSQYVGYEKKDINHYIL